MAPASLASRTSRDSRSASFLISSADSTLPSRTPPLMTRFGLSLAKSRRPFADSTGSPVTKATAVGPLNRSSSVEIPASLAAILVSVFFTTAYWAFSPSERRRFLSCATVRPRYSVSTAAFELRNCSASSATAAALSGLAMSVGLLPGDDDRSEGAVKNETPRRRRTGRSSTGIRSASNELTGALPQSPARVVRGIQRILRPPGPLTSARQRPAVFGFCRRVRDRIAVKQIRWYDAQLCASSIISARSVVSLAGGAGDRHRLV